MYGVIILIYQDNREILWYLIKANKKNVGMEYIKQIIKKESQKENKDNDFLV
jgi:hypothetical protein